MHKRVPIFILFSYHSLWLSFNLLELNLYIILFDLDLSFFQLLRLQYIFTQYNLVIWLINFIQ